MRYIIGNALSPRRSSICFPQKKITVEHATSFSRPSGYEMRVVSMNNTSLSIEFTTGW